MRNFILLIIIATILSCKAQITTVDIYSANHNGEDNYYYKDNNNDFNHFIGTWVYTDGNTSLTIKLDKKVNKHIEDTFSNYYTDALVGEAQYIENGIEKLNTLDNLLNDHDDPFDYMITGDFIMKNGDGGCNECGPDDIKIHCLYSEPDCYRPGITNYMLLRHYIEDGVEKIECKLIARGQPHFSSGDAVCPGNALPYGRYTLVKQ